MTLTVEAPTDPQLDYIRSLCEERGFPLPVVWSKQHASELIEQAAGPRVSPARVERRCPLLTPSLCGKCS